MAARKVDTRFSCTVCGDTISESSRKMWVDDGGFLCRNCALLVRYRRMKGDRGRSGRRIWELGSRER